MKLQKLVSSNLHFKCSTSIKSMQIEVTVSFQVCTDKVLQVAHHRGKLRCSNSMSNHRWQLQSFFKQRCRGISCGLSVRKHGPLTG